MRVAEGTISAIVLTYRKGWILSQFLRSLQAQTRPPDQVVVVDDASDDGTVQALGLIPPAYELIRLEANRGQSHARNLGLARASGDLVVFLDADISMRADMLEGLEAALLAKPGASFAYGHYMRKGRLRGQQRAKVWDSVTLRKMNYVSVMSLVRRAHLPMPAFDESLRSLEDWDLWLTMADQGRQGVLVDRCLFDAYYRAGDITPSTDEARAREAILRKHALMRAGSP